MINKSTAWKHLRSHPSTSWHTLLLRPKTLIFNWMQKDRKIIMSKVILSTQIYKPIQRLIEIFIKIQGHLIINICNFEWLDFVLPNNVVVGLL